MRRGTRVGQAYIALSADGSGINDDIVNAVEDAEPGVERSGDRAGEKYGNRFGARFKADTDKIAKQAGEKLASEMGTSGTASGKNFTKNFGDGVDDHTFDRIAERAAQHFAANFVGTLESRLEGGGGSGPLSTLFDRLMAKAVSGNSGTRKRDTGLTGLDDWLSGTHFRNNALNILAKSLGGAVHGVESLFTVIGKSGPFKSFSAGLSDITAKSETFQKISASLSGEGGAIGGSIGKGLSAIAESGPGAAVAIIAVAAGLTLLVSVANALLAILVALASTIASALVAALAIGAAGLAAFGAAAGLATFAFMSMTDEQKKALKTAFKPLHEEAIGLGQVMLKQMVPAFDSWSKHLQVALALAEPLAKVMGGALAEAGNIITKSFSGSGFREFFDALGTTLPNIVASASHALGGFLNGVLGLLAPLLPLVAQFMHYLAGVALTFQRWATSVQGQNAIVTFVDNAVTSLKSLWSFLGAVGGLLSAVLFNTSAQSAGNTIFDSMTNAVKRFTEYLKANPGKLAEWFQEGVTFAQSLGTAIVTITRALQELNQSGVIDGIARLVSLGAAAFDSYARLPTVLKYVVNPLKAISDAMGHIADIAKLSGAAVVAAFAVIIGAVALVLDALAGTFKALSKIPGIGKAFKSTASNIQSAADDVTDFGKRLGSLSRNIVIGISADTGLAAGTINRFVQQIEALHVNVKVTASTNATVAEAAAISPEHPGGGSSSSLNNQISGLVNSGSSALSGTTGGGGGGAPKYHNPYVAFANKLIKDGPSVAAQIRNAILTVNKQVAAVILSVSRSADVASLQSSLSDTISSIQTAATETVNTAQSALNSAAQSLASATSKNAVKKALAQVHQAQRDLLAALANQKKIQAAAKLLAAQKIVTSANVDALLAGFKMANATLADYAAARAKVVAMLEDANQKLAAAISLRDQYQTTVSDALKSFASLTSAQAQTINGIEQALTASDITTNLQDKLTKIQTFQHDLQLLLAQGLSNDAYKQIVDAGVEAGTTYAQALLNGGTGAIQQTNGLVDQINAISDSLGTETSNRLYQAGVDAAQGLVDGLTSLSAELDSAATKLGNTIAAALKKALGIASPSRVAMGIMDDFGDGGVIGLDNQQPKWSAASARLSSKVAISPEVAAYQSQQAQGGVSGNQKDPRFRDLVVNTPTEDPKAVAIEVLNEVTGRL